MEPRVTKDNLRVYLAIKKADERSHIVRSSVLPEVKSTASPNPKF